MFWFLKCFMEDLEILLACVAGVRRGGKGEKMSALLLTLSLPFYAKILQDNVTISEEHQRRETDSHATLECQNFSMNQWVHVHNCKFKIHNFATG